MVLPWQADNCSDTNSDDHVTKNTTGPSTVDTYHHDRNFRRSFAGKVEDYTPGITTRMCQAAGAPDCLG